MSSTSLTDSIKKILREPLDQKDSLNSVQDADSLGSTWSNSVHENSPCIQLLEIRDSPVSISENNVDEKIHSAIELEEDIARVDSFDSHKLTNDQKLSFDSNEIVKPQVSNGDLRLPLAEEQDDSLCIEKKLTENLVSATLAYKEASNNQCDLLRAQTDAIIRLAAAIEDQNAMMNRYHDFVREHCSELFATREDRQ